MEPILLEEKDVVVVEPKPKQVGSIFRLQSLSITYPRGSEEASFYLAWDAMTTDREIVGDTKYVNSNAVFADAEECPELKVAIGAILAAIKPYKALLDKRAADLKKLQDEVAAAQQELAEAQARARAGL